MFEIIPYDNNYCFIIALKNKRSYELLISSSIPTVGGVYLAVQFITTKEKPGKLQVY